MTTPARRSAISLWWYPAWPLTHRRDSEFWRRATTDRSTPHRSALAVRASWRGVDWGEGIRLEPRTTAIESVTTATEAPGGAKHMPRRTAAIVARVENESDGTRLTRAMSPGDGSTQLAPVCDAAAGVAITKASSVNATTRLAPLRRAWQVGAASTTGRGGSDRAPATTASLVVLVTTHRTKTPSLRRQVGGTNNNNSLGNGRGNALVGRANTDHPDRRCRSPSSLATMWLGWVAKFGSTAKSIDLCRVTTTSTAEHEQTHQLREKKVGEWGSHVSTHPPTNASLGLRVGGYLSVFHKARWPQHFMPS
jgi:hypothetical protein